MGFVLQYGLVNMTAEIAFGGWGFGFEILVHGGKTADLSCCDVSGDVIPVWNEKL